MLEPVFGVECGSPLAWISTERNGFVVGPQQTIDDKRVINISVLQKWLWLDFRHQKLTHSRLNHGRQTTGRYRGTQGFQIQHAPILTRPSLCLTMPVAASLCCLYKASGFAPRTTWGFALLASPQAVASPVLSPARPNDPRCDTTRVGVDVVLGAYPG